MGAHNAAVREATVKRGNEKPEQGGRPRWWREKSIYTTGNSFVAALWGGEGSSTSRREIIIARMSEGLSLRKGHLIVLAD